MSGGVIWMPNNHHQQELEIEDSREMALSYLSRFLGQIESDMAATLSIVGQRCWNGVKRAPLLVSHS